MADSELSKAWRSAVAQVRRQQPGAAFDTWIDEVRPLACSDGVVRLAVASPMAREIMARRFADPLRQALSEVLARPVGLDLQLESELAGEPEAPAAPLNGAVNDAPAAGEGLTALPLNPRFTFENFVPGPSNRFPRAAAEAVAKAPAAAYNPLFIYGGVGLGKTHLMQAVGHRLAALNPGATIAYVSGETFLHQFVSSIREDRMSEFRQRYRSVDLWLVDDIQFIASRDSTRTEAEFFHTFNALHATNKQIVITSDRPPKDLLIEDRLRNRFEWGLITDIKPPDIETRLAILQKRAHEERLAVDDEVLMYIAQVVRDSIRLLEGALLRVVASASLLDEQVTLALARECLRDYSIGERPPQLEAGVVLEVTARHFGFGEADLKDKSRRAELVTARQVAMYLCRELLGSSFAEIGGWFGRDHSTVMHGCQKISDRLAAGDAALVAALERLGSELEGRRRD